MSTSQLPHCLVPKPIAKSQPLSAVVVLAWLCKPDFEGRDPSARNERYLAERFFGENFLLVRNFVENLISTQLVNDKLIERFDSFFISFFSFRPLIPIKRRRILKETRKKLREKGTKIGKESEEI